MGALAETHRSAPATRFRLSFDMNPDAYPEELQAYMPGIADLLRALTLEGQLATAEGEFELRADALMNGVERTRTDLRLFGTESQWHITSSLLGRETLTLDVSSLLEFAIKCYSHLGIPLQRVAILATPYVHTLPFRGIYQRITTTLYTDPGTHTLTWSDMIYMGNIVRMLTEDNTQLSMWTRALAMETGYENYLFDLIQNMPDWLQTFIPATGFTVTKDESTETWTTNTLTLLTREWDQAGGQSIAVTLPPMLDGSVLTLNAALLPDGDLYHVSANFLIDDGEGGTLLKLHAEGSLPTGLPVAREFSLLWDAEGMIVGGDGVHLRFSGEPIDGGVVIRQWTPDSGDVMLSVTAELERTEADFSADVAGESVHVLSVNGETLGELMNSIASPMIRGLLPLIAQAPTSSCQTLMNLLEDSGVFALLTEGFMTEEEFWDEGWDEY